MPRSVPRAFAPGAVRSLSNLGRGSIARRLLPAMRTPHDPRPADRLVEHYATALAVARRKYPGLSPADHEDIVQEAVANVLDRLRRGALDDVELDPLRVVFTAGAHVLQDRHRATVSFDVHTGATDGVERFVDRSVTPLSPEERLLERDAALTRGVSCSSSSTSTSAAPSRCGWSTSACRSRSPPSSASRSAVTAICASLRCASSPPASRERRCRAMPRSRWAPIAPGAPGSPREGRLRGPAE